MSLNKKVLAISDSMSFHERARFKEAVRAAADVATDYPLLPTSDVDARPAMGEESGDKLTPQQRLAVAALIGGATFSAAAQAAGCGRKTLFNWRRQPAFAAAVERTSREALDVAVVRVRNLMLRATRVIGDALLDRSAGPQQAFKVINSPRLWTLASTELANVAVDEDEGAGAPSDVAGGAGGSAASASTV